MIGAIWKLEQCLGSTGSWNAAYGLIAAVLG